MNHWEELTQEDISEIEKIHHLWINAEVQGNSLDILNFCSDNVRWMIPNSEILIGKEAARPLLVTSNIKILEIHTDKLEIQGSQTFAYKTSRFKTRLIVLEARQEQVITGNHLWILQKSKSEEWKVTFVTWQILETEV
jgi:ketosteroid isomerase-like protein